MADAVPTAAQTDQITAVDILKICIEPVPGQTTGIVTYTLRETWQSGKATTRDGVVRAADFAACIAAFCQAAPRKKFLQYLSAASYETNLNPQ